MDHQQESKQENEPSSQNFTAAEGRLMMQVHDLEVKLFRLKQIEDLLAAPKTPVDAQLAASGERKAILSTVTKPVGVPIAVFRAQSDENAAMVAQMFEDLKSGKIHLS